MNWAHRQATCNQHVHRTEVDGGGTIGGVFSVTCVANLHDLHHAGVERPNGMVASALWFSVEIGSCTTLGSIVWRAFYVTVHGLMSSLFSCRSDGTDFVKEAADQVATPRLL